MSGPVGDGTDRRELLGAAAAAVGGALVTASGASGAARRDVEFLREAVALEQRLALAFATAAVPRPLAAQSRLFARHAREHAATLTASLRRRGGNPTPPAARGPRAFPPALLRLEEEAVGFYHRALGELRDTRLILFMASAMTGHAQQLVVLRQALGREPLPHAFESGRTPAALQLG
ncbi:MAG: hypothetical protein ABR581_03995 [Thermoleophilaceae bacterium]